jgi:hypothetical protein
VGRVIEDGHPAVADDIIRRMLTFSRNPDVAEQQMRAIIFYLTTFGHIDGDFDESEKKFVREYIEKLVQHRVATGMPDASPEVAEELTRKFTKHFLEVFQNIDAHVQELFTEAVSQEENQDDFVHMKLKVRCFEIFQNFDEENQEQLMATVDELIHADGQVHPAEAKFRAELGQLLHSDLDVEMVEDEIRPTIEMRKPVTLPPPPEPHPFFDQFEFHYSSDPDRISKQVSADMALLDRAIALLDEKRMAGAGKLDGVEQLADLDDQGPFLDGHVHVLPRRKPGSVELIVLGDLHGCYSNLKAAVLQSGFFDKLAAFKKDPEKNPDPKLVFLGDYIDRGMFSLNGVLRTVLQTLVTAPEHVYVLRGNHEYYLEYKGQIYGGVKPAEAINTLKPHLPVDVFRHYMRLFDALPNVLLHNGIMFVHGGIPRDRLIKEKYKDLSSLNDPDMRFQMLWSDPSSVDVIPAELQDQSARFPFGRLQAAAFLRRMGCHTLVRGHEKVDDGFVRNYDDEQVALITVFSAGGTTNQDLPEDSTYRSVKPHAVSIESKGDTSMITPWAIDYERYNDPKYNAFFRASPEIEHRED